MLSNILYRYPILETVLLQKVFQHILRCAPLPGCIQRLAGQILHRVHGFPVFQNVQHAQRIDGDHDRLAIGLVGQHRSEVHRYGSDIDLAVDKLAGHHIRRIQQLNGERAAFLLHQISKAHAGRPFQGGYPQGGLRLFASTPHAQQQQAGKQSTE